jgi:cell division protein FtsI/penicillin-binding protein 2
LAKNAAGFSGSRLSAVGGAVLASVVASGGLRISPQIVAAVRNSAGNRIISAPLLQPRVIPAAVASDLSMMMKQTCDSGSAAKSFRRGSTFWASTTAAGKTGTLDANDPFPMQFSWFVGFAPAATPQYVISVVLGNSENWHKKGHQVAATMLESAIKHDRAAERTARATSPTVQW